MTDPTDGNEQRPEQDDLSTSYRKAAPVLDGVWQMIASALLGCGGGYWLDTHFGTRPWLLVVGTILGMAAGLTLLLRAALSLSKKREPPRP